MSKWIAVLLVAFSVACSNPNAPTSVSPASTVAPVTSSPAPGSDAPPPVAPAVPTVQTGLDRFGCFSSTVADILNWDLPASLVPDGAKITRGYSHSPDPNPTCQPVTANLRTDNDHLRFWRHFSTPHSPLVVQFDTFIFNCGSAQVDISVDGVNVLAVIVNYPEACMDPPPPPPDPPVPPVPPVDPPVVPPPPPPVCQTGDPACDKGGPPSPPPVACVAKGPNATVVGTAYNGSFDFDVLKGTHVLSLVSYVLDGVHTYPQKFHERKVATFGPGHHTWYIEPQWRNRQEDLYCGEYPEGLDLTDDNAAYWEAKTIAGDASQCEWCMLRGIRKTKNIVWGTF